jgi:hypothetical protein
LLAARRAAVVEVEAPWPAVVEVEAPWAAVVEVEAPWAALVEAEAPRAATQLPWEAQLRPVAAVAKSAAAPPWVRAAPSQVARASAAWEARPPAEDRAAAL